MMFIKPENIDQNHSLKKNFSNILLFLRIVLFKFKDNIIINTGYLITNSYWVKMLCQRNLGKKGKGTSGKKRF